MSTKSGTNAFHGQGTYTIRNDVVTNTDGFGNHIENLAVGMKREMPRSGIGGNFDERRLAGRDRSRRRIKSVDEYFIKTCRTARRVRMVAGKIAGHSTCAIARSEGLSRDWAAKELGSPECRQILASLVDPTLERIAELFKAVLDTIETALKADKMVVAEGPELLGPDHYGRLTAVKRFWNYLPRSGRCGHFGKATDPNSAITRPPAVEGGRPA